MHISIQTYVLKKRPDEINNRYTFSWICTYTYTCSYRYTRNTYTCTCQYTRTYAKKDPMKTTTDMLLSESGVELFRLVLEGFCSLHTNTITHMHIHMQKRPDENNNRYAFLWICCVELFRLVLEGFCALHTHVLMHTCTCQREPMKTTTDMLLSESVVWNFSA